MRAILFIILLCLVLSLRFLHFFYTKPIYKDQQLVTFTHTFLEEPKRYTNHQLFIVDNIVIRLSRFPEYKYGTSIEIKGKVTVKKVEDRVVTSLSYPKVKIVKTPFTPVLSLIGSIRNRVIESFTRTLGRDEGGLLLGVVFGIKNQISQEFMDRLQKTGMLHVVAASGMNVTMVSEVFLGILILFLNRYIAIIGTVFLLIIYVLISGAESSIVRAAIMGSIAFSAQLFGRQNMSVLALILAAFLILLVSPQSLFEVGFLLSFAATLGILYYKPLLDKVLPRLISVIKDDVSTSFSAQLTTSPILLSVFGSISFISLIVNLLLLWMIPFLMIGGGVAAILSLFSPILSVAFLYLMMPLLVLFKFIVSVFTNIPLPIEISSLPLVIVIGYYLLLFGCLLLWRRHTKRYA